MRVLYGVFNGNGVLSMLDIVVSFVIAYWQRGKLQKGKINLFTIFFYLILLFFIVCGAISVFCTEIPDILDKKLNDARRELVESHLVLDDDAQKIYNNILHTSGIFDNIIVISQTPESGEIVRKNSVVEVELKEAADSPEVTDEPTVQNPDDTNTPPVSTATPTPTTLPTSTTSITTQTPIAIPKPTPKPTTPTPSPTPTATPSPTSTPTPKPTPNGSTNTGSNANTGNNQPTGQPTSDYTPNNPSSDPGFSGGYNPGGGVDDGGTGDLQPQAPRSDY